MRAATRLGRVVNQDIVRCVELLTVAVRLLEVVADDLGRRGVAQPVPEPLGEALVEVGALTLRDRLVGRVADEHVTEAEAVITGQDRLIWSDERLAHQREELGADAGALGFREELHDGAAMEDAPFDRAALEHRALLRREPVDARRQERLERQRDRERLVAVLALHRDELLNEERVPFGRLDDARSLLAAELAERLDEMRRVGPRERLQREDKRVRTWRRPTRTSIE